jgi:hypothetical protein
VTNTEQTDGISYLRQVAPYPTSEEDVTAEGLVKHLLTQVFLQDARVQERLTAGEPILPVAAVVPGLWATARLLRAAIDTDSATADALARDIWDAWTDGGALTEWAWHWADSYGLDADRLVAAARTAAAREAAK